jgi:hypothetical protein
MLQPEKSGCKILELIIPAWGRIKPDLVDPIPAPYCTSSTLYHPWILTLVLVLMSQISIVRHPISLPHGT